MNNVELILDSHDNFDKYVQNFDVGIFNLGYLPQVHFLHTQSLFSYFHPILILNISIIISYLIY